MIDITESFITGNENIEQNVELEWEIFFYQWTVWVLSSKQISVNIIEWTGFPREVKAVIVKS